MKKLSLIWTITVLLILSSSVFAQKTSFLDQLRIGFGAGANSAQIINIMPYNIFEDLSGLSYENEYSPMLQNIGNQYFVHLEWFNDFVILNLKPGTYTHQFSKLNTIVFTNETIEQESPYLLRYISIPIELRYRLDLQRFRPYAGLSASYSHLLGSHDAANQTFIRPKFSAGASIGTYIDLRFIILDFNIGYRSGLHNISSKAGRFETGNGMSFAQDDLLLNDLQVSLSLLFSLQKQRRFSNIECYY